jgi:hypothetical protein
MLCTQISVGETSICKFTENLRDAFFSFTQLKPLALFVMDFVATDSFYCVGGRGVFVLTVCIIHVTLAQTLVLFDGQ